MNLSEAIEVVGKMLDCYPNGGQNATRGYIGALAAVLVTYPRCVTHKAADPLTGVPRDCRFLPTPADVIAWCEREVADMRKIVERDDREHHVAGEMKSLRDASARLVEDRKARPSYDELKAKYGPNWGLGEDQQDIAAKEARAAELARANHTAFQRECAAAGVPLDSAVSPSLAAILRPHYREAAE